VLYIINLIENLCRKRLKYLEEKYSGMEYNVDNTTIYTLQFADDHVVMAQSKEDFEHMCRKLQEEYSN